jgi:hypothetical protein
MIDVSTMEAWASTEKQRAILDTYTEASRMFAPRFKSHMTVIVEEILAETRPMAICLGGSFGRNEGALYLSKGFVSPLRDYDIVIIADENIDSALIERIRRRIHARIGLQEPYSRTMEFERFTVWITQSRLVDLNRLPLLKFYELKENSVLLWGSDVRDKIHLSLKQVSPYNGILILFSKIEGLLGFIPAPLPVSSGRLGDRSMDLIYECLKTYAEMGTCLMLLSEHYERSFVERCESAAKLFDTQFEGLKRMRDGLDRLMLACAYRRLVLDENFVDSIDTWHVLSQTVNDLVIGIRYYVNEAYGIDVVAGEAVAMFDDCLKRLGTVAVFDVIDYNIRRRFRKIPRFITRVATQLYLRYSLLGFYVQGRRMHYPIKWSLIFRPHAHIMMRLWAIGYALLSCVAGPLALRERAMRDAAVRLRELVCERYVEDCLSGENIESVFFRLQRVTLDLMQIGDSVLHGK